MLHTRYRLHLFSFLFFSVFSFLYISYHRLSEKPRSSRPSSSSSSLSSVSPSSPSTTTDEPTVRVFTTLLRYFVEYPLNDVQFGELGQRVQILRDWIQTSEATTAPLTSGQRREIYQAAEGLAVSLFPFIRNPANLNDTRPLDTLRRSYIPGSKGIVIPVGKGNFRYACHLITNLRDVLRSNLPIQIAYAGDSDLPSDYREAIVSLDSGIEPLDVKTVLDDSTTQLGGGGGGGWAVKPFAVLASRFEQVILLDADDVFLQKPEAIFERHSGYKNTGTLLFHDRLLWKDAFKERHRWWMEEMKHQPPSASLLQSLVYTENYAEEGDSGVVAIDKGRLPVLLGLLHICWQNSKSTRDKVTYTITYGDKESWWFGFELSAVPFAFEFHYGSMLGYLRPENETRANIGPEICSFAIAHTDEEDKLLWYNGSLLKNKAMDQESFLVPSHWMMDGKWDKGQTKSDMSCMHGAPVRVVDKRERKILEQTVRRSKEVDEKFRSLWRFESG
ncbi:hypothetical protein GP486_003307 [Trichoglossum hirsutum]|uniref:Alpha-1,3-mannosyltransferase n=1 Tax=Trichoglossum hirsutum TaxID=265104 RepID=A0A9P8RQU6_9PEZI|nr:hypothetical protein GP486_003307 [Trichoglossum hirsutum]